MSNAYYQRLPHVLALLDIHLKSYEQIKCYARKYRHPHPTDTRAWSQIIVSALTGIPGRGRKKGSDLEDGSDVKAANCWDAIDTPRFNGCIKAGTKSKTANSLKSLDEMPYLFFVLWDEAERTKEKRCRIWVVRTKHDRYFREMAERWYQQRAQGTIKSNNFQLHPPRNKDSNMFTNNCGNLLYPLLLDARYNGQRYVVHHFDPTVLERGECSQAAADQPDT